MAALISDEFEKLKERVAEALGIPRRMLDDDYEFSSESPLKLTGGELPGYVGVDLAKGEDETVVCTSNGSHVFKYALGSDTTELVKFMQDYLQAPDSGPDPKAAALGETLSAANRKVGR